MPDLDRAAILLHLDPSARPEAVAGLRAGLGPHMRLVLMEPALWPDALARAVAALAATDPRIAILPATLRHREPRQVGEALVLAGDADWLIVVDRHCTLAAGALAALAATDAPIAYADEPGFHKPAWSIDVALEQDLAGPFALLRRDALDAIADAPLTTPHDLALRCAARGFAVAHLATRLGQRDGPRHDQPGPHAVAAALATLASDAVAPHAIPSTLLPGRHRIAWRPATPPTISVIIPTRDHAVLLATCLDGLLHRTDHPVHEVIIADNGSVEPETAALFDALSDNPRIRILPVPGPFNYAHINNVAASAATGTLLLLLNNDIEVLEPSWLGELAGHAMRPKVGAVGARLLYPDGTVQHGGIVLGVGSFEGGAGVAGHFGLGRPSDDPGYQGQLATTRALSAVTGACMMLRRDLYARVGGMDEEHLAVALNDLDLCLRIRASGLAVIWTPFATLRHYESASRGAETDPAQAARFRQECRRMRDRWGPVLDTDPFYNPHFSRWDHSFLPRGHPGTKSTNH